jgi:hypothetical protein
MRGFRSIVAVAVLVTAGGALGWPEITEDQMLRQYVDHSGFNWKSKRTAHFRLYFEKDSEASRYIGALKRNVETDRIRVLSLIGGSDYQPIIHAFFLNSGAQMAQLVGQPVDGRSRPVQHAVFSVVNPNRLHLTHEICHEIASNLWGAAEPWVEEGLAVYADEGSNAYYDSWTLLGSRDLIPLDKLVNPDWRSSMYPADTTYPELGSFVKFLHDRYGVESIRRIWQGGSRSIPQVLGKPLADLERDWRDSLVRQFPEPPTRHYRGSEAGIWIE